MDTSSTNDRTCQRQLWRPRDNKDKGNKGQVPAGLWLSSGTAHSHPALSNAKWSYRATQAFMSQDRSVNTDCTTA